MAHAIFRNASGRRYEVGFDENAMSFEILLGAECVEIVLESRDPVIPERQRFALLNLPRAVFDAAARLALGGDADGAARRPRSK